MVVEGEVLVDAIFVGTDHYTAAFGVGSRTTPEGTRSHTWCNQAAHATEMGSSLVCRNACERWTAERNCVCSIAIRGSTHLTVVAQQT